MAAFIAAQRTTYGIPYATACRALGVSQAWLYKWRHGDTSLRQARRQTLTTLVATLFRRHRGTYGSPRITDDLREMGWRVSVNTVAAIMAEQHVGDLTEIPNAEGPFYLATCWTCIHGGRSGSPWAPATTPNWRRLRCRWPSRCVAARWPG